MPLIYIFRAFLDLARIFAAFEETCSTKYVE
jgi:hypothetical protein